MSQFTLTLNTLFGENPEILMPNLRHAFKSSAYRSPENVTLHDLIVAYRAFIKTPGKSAAKPVKAMAMREIENFLAVHIPNLHSAFVAVTLGDDCKVGHYGMFKDCTIKLASDKESIQEIQAKRTVDQEAALSKKFEIKVAEKYLQLLQSSQKRGLDFNLSIADVRALLTRKTCYYSKVKFSPVSGLPNSRTIDRLDCNKGYVKGNVVACTFAMNAFKENAFEHKKVDLKSIQRMLEVLLRTATGS